VATEAVPVALKSTLAQPPGAAFPALGATEVVDDVGGRVPLRGDARPPAPAPAATAPVTGAAAVLRPLLLLLTPTGAVFVVGDA